jgi:hypothetical protein
VYLEKARASEEALHPTVETIGGVIEIILINSTQINIFMILFY